MFNPHIHQQQQQQQQQFHQHLRQLQQLFQQQQPPPPPPAQPPPGHHVAHHHHQTPRALPVPPQTAPPPRMVNLCQTTQTTIIAPNPMLQGAILMQQMQGNMRSFGMGGQQFRQFFTAGTRSSLLGPVPMGMAIKSPMMGFPATRPFHPHARYYNNTAAIGTTTTAPSTSSSPSSFTTTDTTARQSDRKRESEQMASGGTENQPAASSTNDDKPETDGAVGGVDEQLDEPAVKKKRTEASDTTTVSGADGEILSSDCNSNTEENQPDDAILLEEGDSTGESDVVEALDESRLDESCLSAPSPSGRLGEDDQQVILNSEKTTQGKDASSGSPDNQDEGEESVADGATKFYCYLCSITCHNQLNFRSHMNSVSHQQRMMEIQHMSNACLVTLLPRVQESLQAACKDGPAFEEKKADLKNWCTTCHTHFTNSIMDHRRTEEHKLASRTAISSCTVCKKHFRTSQIFVEHLQSQEHRHKMEKLQEKESCEALAKLTAMDTDGFSLEEGEGSEVEEVEERRRNEEDQDCSENEDDWPPFKEVTLKNMASDEQYDPDTVYGSSFFVPVAGFICRLCNKFYHFESSALHTHCKSLTHFENLKRCRALLSQKGAAVESSRASPLASDNLRPITETTTDWSCGNSFSDDTGLVTNLDSLEPIIALSRLQTQAENQQQEKESQPDQTSQDLTIASATRTGSKDQDSSIDSKEVETTPEASVAQESTAELPAGGSEELDSGAAAAEDGIEEEAKEEEEEAAEEAPAPAPVVTGKKNSTGKAKAAPKRRSGRATNRR